MSFFTVYVMIIATVNLGLGFAVSAYLGKRYRLMTASAGLNADGTSGPLAGQCSASAPAAQGQLSDQSEPVSAGPSQHLAAPHSEALPSDSAGEFARLAAQLGGEKPTASASGDAERSSSASPQSDAPSDSQAAQPLSAAMAPIAAMQHEVDRYQHKLTETDEAFRSRIGPADAAEIEAALSGLLAATEEYLKHREQLHKSLEESWAAKEQLQPVRDELAEAIRSQDEQISASRQVFQAFHPQGDIAAQHSEAISHTSKLANTNYRLRDTLAEAALRVSAAERSPGQPESLSAKDELTGIDNRAALEERVRQWQQRDPHGIRRLSLAVIDVDRCSKLNEQYGHKVVDKLLRAIGQILLSQTRDVCDCARLAGQRFALFCPDAPMRSVTQLVEQIRQTIELTHFRAGEQEIRPTVSCAVTALRAEEQHRELFSRLEGALHEAKLSGRNRTFVHEGDYPTPVVPPNLALEEKHITL